MQLTGREADAQEAAAKAASMEAAEVGYSQLARYHSLAGNRDEVLRYLRGYLELRGAPHQTFKLGEDEDYAWLVGDPEFDAFVAEFTGRTPGSARQVSK